MSRSFLAQRDVMPDVAARQVERYRQMTPSEKLALADALWDLAFAAASAGVRQRHPALDDAAVTAMVRQQFRDATD